MHEIPRSIETDAKLTWLEQFAMTEIETMTELGLCRIANFCGRKKFLRDEVYGARIFGEPYSYYSLPNLPENSTPPYMTTSKTLGFIASVFKRIHSTETLMNLSATIKPFKLIIHDSFRLPTPDDRQFYMENMDYDTFWVTPQLNKIDDSLIGMKPQE